MTLLSCLAASTILFAIGPRSDPAFYRFAPTPPMGWNSWDCFGTGVVESQVRANADYMATHLLKHGWNVVTIDIDWFIPGAKSWDYAENAPIDMNRYGLVQPAPDRFPSSSNGRGFKPLADDLHRKGLKLGVHLLRGVPRRAANAKLPIERSSFTCDQIANRSDLCRWNPDMYGVDMSKPGAQAYYDSLFKQLADWGIDFVKVDDLSTPYHGAEIEAIRKAIDKSGRKMVLSTSPGPTGLDHGQDIESNANMWRVSDDFWDDWRPLKEQFERLDRWTPFRGGGHWPDADMLPLGAVRQGKPDSWTHFTPNEQKTLMTLWCMAKSPLIFGGDLPKTDSATEALITNDEVLNIDRSSQGNRQLWRRGDRVAWVAEIPHSHDKYLALFNAANQRDLDLNRATYRSPVVDRKTSGQSVKIDIDLTGAKKLYLYADDGGDGNFGDHVVWAHPTISTASGQLKLTDLRWVSATQGYGQTQINRSTTGKQLILNDQSVDFGIGTHANSIIEFDLPEGAMKFTTEAGLGKEGVVLDHGATVRFAVFTQDPMTGSADPDAQFDFDLKDLGLAGPVEIRDLWRHKSLGQFVDQFTCRVPWHGAELFRISPKASSVR